MPFVLDAGIAACWALDDEDDRVADLTFERIRTDEARVPALWWFEVRNILVVNERRNRLTETATAAFLRELAQMRVLVDRSPDVSDVLTCPPASAERLRRELPGTRPPRWHPARDAQ